MKCSGIGLRARLLWLVLFAVTPVLGLIAYTAVSQRDEATAAAKRDTMSLVSLAAREQRELIASTRRLLVGLAQVPAVRRLDRDACHRLMVEMSRPYPYYTNIGVATPGGEVVCSAVPLQKRVTIADRSYFRRALITHRLGIGDYQRGRITGINAVNFGYPVIEHGAVRAVVYAAISLDWLKQMVDTVDLPRGSSLMVVDSAGTVLARAPQGGHWSGRSVRRSALVSTVLARRRKGTAELAGVDGVRRLYAFAPLDAAPRGNVYVSVGIPTAVAYAAERRTFRHSMELFAGMAMLALAGAWVGSDVFVLRHVRQLARAARRMGRGDLSARTGMPQGKDEFGELVGAFDGMALSLERIDRALKTLSAGNRAVVRAPNERTLLEQMCRVIVEVGGYPCAWVGYRVHDRDKTVKPVAQAGFEGGMETLSATLSGGLTISWADSAQGGGPLGTAIRTGTQRVAQNLLTDPGYALWRDAARSCGFASVGAFPLRVGEQVIGALAIYAKEPDAFNKEELDLLSEAAEDLSFGIGTLRTRAEHERAHETIKRMAYYDGLTGLPNQLHLQECLEARLRDGGACPDATAIVLLDLDRFGEINAALGFHQGDALLQEVGRRLSAAAGDDAVVARMRGDEFAVMLSVRDMDDAGEAATRILDALEAPFGAGRLTLHVSAVAGISLAPRHGKDAARLMRHADVAMHQAKRSGQRYVFYDKERDEHKPHHLALAGELRRAIEGGELTLYYQPKASLACGRVCGVEALVRWFHPQRGPIPPDQFIPLAERTGLIKPLTDRVLGLALAQSRAWAVRGLSLPIAVNLSARNLRDANLADALERLLADTGARTGALDLEITESAVMEDPEGALETLRRLRALGMALFIDDFGTGYSSLGYLKRLPVSAVKIDKSFVFDMLENGDSAAIVRSTITLAHDLGLEVVAEGVETRAVWDALHALGCDVAQGYYISKPLPAKQFIEWWTEHQGGFEPASVPVQGDVPA